MSDVVILKRCDLLYFLKTVDLISAKLPLINMVSRALSAEFTATLNVATCTNKKRLWIVTYTPTTMTYKGNECELKSGSPIMMIIEVGRHKLKTRQLTLMTVRR
jgi:hypothetical protein